MIGVIGLSACSIGWVTTDFTTTYNDPIPVKAKGAEQPMHHPDISVYPISYRQKTPISSGFAGGNMINLRAKPSTKSAIVSKLPLGTPITVHKQDKEATQGLRQDHWYHVSAKVNGKKVDGYLFGPTINPHRITGDFDLDGELEVVYASYNERREMLMHYHNPNGDSPLSWTIIGRFSNTHGTSEDAALKIIPTETAGIPLLKVEVDCTEACNGAVWTKYLSFSNAGIRRALEIEENENSDTQVGIDFHAQSKSITLTTKDNAVFQTQKYNLKNGVYRSATPLIEKTQSMAKKEITTPSTEIERSTLSTKEVTLKKPPQKESNTIAANQKSATDATPDKKEKMAAVNAKPKDKTKSENKPTAVQAIAKQATLKTTESQPMEKKKPSEIDTKKPVAKASNQEP